MTQSNSTWKIDTGHSEIQFKVKHLGISNVAGTFKHFEGTVLSANEDFNNAQVQCSIKTASLDTNNSQRDEHLKSEGFLDVNRFPELIFDGLLHLTNDHYKLAGELSLRDVKRPVVLDVEFTGTGKGRFNDMRAGFEASGKINRKDFGLTWNILTEAGGFVIGEEIKLHFDIQLIKQ